MFILFLNDVRSPKVGDMTAVCRSETKQALKDLIARETAAPYRDRVAPPGTPSYVYVKSFRKGGPLEWYNPPSDNPDYERGHFKHMQPLEEVIRTQVEAVAKSIAAQLTEQYEALVTSKPDVSTL